MLSLTDNYSSEGSLTQRDYKPLRTGYFKLDLQEDWLELVSRYNYDLFATLTFKEDIEPWKAQKRFQKWLGSINCDLYGWRYRRKGKGIRYAVAYEYQKRGVLHFHALLGAEGLDKLYRVRLDKLWKCNGQRNKQGVLIDRLVNGYAWIEPYDPARGARHYLTKYTLKGGVIDLYIPRSEREEVPVVSETTAG